jgi:hypothetical protein
LQGKDGHIASVAPTRKGAKEFLKTAGLARQEEEDAQIPLGASLGEGSKQRELVRALSRGSHVGQRCGEFQLGKYNKQ